jgi:tRNA-dihydrouridine synthase
VAEPSHRQKHDLVCEHYQDMLCYYGSELGTRVARKHLGWYVDQFFADDCAARSFWRGAMFCEASPGVTLRRVHDMFNAAGNGYRLAS